MSIANVPAELATTPFTTATARRCGLSQSALRSAPWRRLLRGVWVHASVPDSRELRLAAVRLVIPDRAVVCAISAAWLYGADVQHHDDLDIRVACPKGGRVRTRDGLVACQLTLAPSDVIVIDGVRVTTVVRTAFDCARLLRGVERVVVVDALTHAKLVAIEEIRAYIAGKRRLRYQRSALEVLDLADPLSESPMETRLRILLIDWGLPRPTCQVNVYDARGEFVARLDLAYPELKLAVEYDGSLHWEQRRDDDRRRDRVRALGWVVLVYSATDYYRHPESVCNDVARALRARS